MRLFHQALGRSTSHTAEPHVLDVGTAYCNAQLPLVHDANHLHDGALAEGMLPAEAVALVESFYGAQGTRCAYWTMNPAAPAEMREPLVHHLADLGYKAKVTDVLVLERAAGAAPAPPEGLTLIPARASFRHVRELLERIAAECGHPQQVAESWMMHLDEPHWDAVLALREGKAVAYGGVLAVGELGLIENVSVAPESRRQGIGLLIMQRVLEICARSLFKQVMLGVQPHNSGAMALYRKLGFRKAGEVVDHVAPWARGNP